MVFDPNRQLPTGPQTVNEAWFDALIRHQTGLLRFSGSTRNKILQLLDATEADINRQLAERLPNPELGFTTANMRRLDRLRRAIREIRGGAWQEVGQVMREDMTELALNEPLFLNNAFTSIAVIQASPAIPPASTLRSIVTQRPFQGNTLRQWLSNLSRADISRIEGEIAIGMTQGETIQQLTRRVLGSVGQGGRDGVTEITRANAAMIARTATIAISNQAKREFYKENSDLFEQEMYVATLDGRTTRICASLDEKLFPIGEGPLPPLHPNCRSLRVAFFGFDALSTRGAVNTTRRTLLREFTRENDLPNVRTRGDLPRGFKGRFDNFERTRLRELTGPVPAKTSYSDFLRRQPVQVQNDILGITKARLFRRGDLPLDRFVDRRGSELTLSQLARNEADAFRAAGLDPEEFL